MSRISGKFKRGSGAMVRRRIVRKVGTMNNSTADQSACAHLHVEYDKEEHRGTVFGEHWRCRDCHTEFYPLPKMFPPGPLMVMEPHATLRDQFAMAALEGMLGSGANHYDAAADETAYSELAYRFADAMLEARK